MILKKLSKKLKKVDKKIKEIIEDNITDIDVNIDPKSNWIILEFRDDIDIEENYDLIKLELLEELGIDSKFFIPIYREKIQNKFVSSLLFDGYLFVESEKDIDSKISSLQEKSQYIKGPLKHKDDFKVILGTDIIRIKKNLLSSIKNNLPKKKDLVVPKVGTFSNLEGEVISVNKTKLIAKVRFKYATRVVEVNISTINLRKV